MNFLAHMFLSCKDADLLAGNFMADFITHKQLKTIVPAFLPGIELHKKIDHFTDHHPKVKESVTLLRPTQGKYAPVTVDVLYDFFLTKNWDRYSGENITVFTERVYEMLTQKSEFFPQKLQDTLPRMIQDDFLMSCKNEERLIKTFYRISKRAKFDNQFNTAHVDLIQHMSLLEAHFKDFFPDLMADVFNFCDCN